MIGFEFSGFRLADPVALLAAAALIRNEIDLFNSVPELPNLPQTLADDWFEPRFARACGVG